MKKAPVKKPERIFVTPASEPGSSAGSRVIPYRAREPGMTSWKVLCLLLLFSACECSKKQDVLLFTTRLEGAVEPCGCTRDPLGGIARLTALVKKHPNAPYVNAGETIENPYEKSDCPNPQRADLIQLVLKELNAENKPGVCELKLKNGVLVVVASVERRKLEKLKLSPDTDLIIWGGAEGSKNLPPFRWNDTGPWVFSAGYQGQYLGKIEFVNLQSREKSPLLLDRRAEEREQKRLILQKRIESLKQKPKSEFIQQRIKMAEDELKTLNGISDKPLKQAHMQFTLVPINRDIKPDTAIASHIEAYEKKLPERLAVCEGQIDCPKPKTGEAVYVGDETCKACHASAYDFWKKAVAKLEAKNQQGELVERLSGHSKAWKTLEDANKTLDRNCIGCHSVGFMKPGGYCKAQDVGAFKDVQCESCHGPGSLHAKTGDKTKIRLAVPESHCRSCHHVPHIPSEESFVYKEKLKVILGPGHGKSLLLRLDK
ncbi:MAG: cytochrome c family protein [Deltaproteobacteria bacterium]|nr:cytochrome c family protein [Deltaproteobacteria bacterium]